jgi:methylglyoxal/glyoxal reductase
VRAKYASVLANSVPGARADPSVDLAGGLASRAELRDGARMPRLGLGVWRSPPGAETERAVGHALSVGYRLVDTATLYQNEADVGRAFRSSGVPRDELFVTTKVWNDDQGYNTTLRAFEASRRQLAVEVVDLYLIHWPVAGRRLETWKALVHLEREGLCRSIGVSNYGVEHLEELLSESDVVPAVDQVELNPYAFRPDLLAYCRRHRIQLEAYAPLTRGRRLDDPRLAAIAAAHRVTPAQVLVRWGLQHGLVVIPKSVRPERISENAEVFGFALTAAEMARMDGWSEAAAGPSDVRRA